MPDPRLANQNLGKFLTLLANLSFFIAVVPTDEERKMMLEMPGQVAELQKKKKAAAKTKPKTCRSENAFNTYIFRVLKQVCSDKQ